jgi:sugar diacid utilization regulator/GAF domain-containing protein
MGKVIAHKERSRVATELAALEQVAAEILGHLDLEATLLSIVNAVTRLTNGDIVGILLADERGERLRMRSCSGHRTIETAHLTVARGQGVAGRVFERGEPIKVDDLMAGQIGEDFQDIIRADGTRSALGAPMLVRGEVIGVVMSWRRRVGPFTDAHVRAISNLANLAAIAIENARLFGAARDNVGHLTEVNELLERQNETLARVAELRQRMADLSLAEVGLGRIIERLAEELGGPLAVFDAGQAPLAFSSAAATGLLAGLRGGNGNARRRHRPRAAETAVFPPHGKRARWLLVRPLLAGEEELGLLCAGLEAEPGRLESMVFELAATICALELSKDRRVAEARSMVRSDFLWDLLGGSVGDHGEALLRAASLHCALPERMRVMLLRAGGEAGHGSTEAALERSAARAVGAVTGVVPLVGRRGPIVAVLLGCGESAEEARELAESVLARIAAERPELEAAAGVSASFADAAMLAEAHAQARSALSAAPMLPGGRGVGVLDQLGVLRFLLAPGDHEALTRFAEGVLGPGLAHDEEHSSDLLLTVEQYLANDCNLQRTAEQIYVHPKTVRYRLDRVEELCGIDLAHQRDRFDAQLAISILGTLALRREPA